MTIAGRTVRRLAAALGTATLLLSAPGPAVAQESITGNYEGTVTLGGQAVGFSLTVQGASDGLEAYFSMPEQSMLNVPVDAVRWQDLSLIHISEPTRPY